MKHANAKRAAAKGSAAKVNKQPSTPTAPASPSGLPSVAHKLNPNWFHPLDREIGKVRALLALVAAHAQYCTEDKDHTSAYALGFLDLAEDAGNELQAAFYAMCERKRIRPETELDWVATSFAIDRANALMDLMSNFCAFHSLEDSTKGDIFRLVNNAGKLLLMALEGLLPSGSAATI